jgi:hypothetical protein
MTPIAKLLKLIQEHPYQLLLEKKSYLRPHQYDNVDIYACMSVGHNLLISHKFYYNCKKSA